MNCQNQERSSGGVVGRVLDSIGMSRGEIGDNLAAERIAE
jgi:hypothetical protein